jgi:ribonucleotide monophosphatase NagD (HAD superfamily)
LIWILKKDIAGANAAKWFSILVNTGVYDPSQGLPTHSPTYFAQDVEEAVTWAVAREYSIAEGKA